MADRNFFVFSNGRMKKTWLEKIKPAIIYRLARRLPDCKTITPTIGESLNRRLSLREKIVMRLHLWTCDKCARYLEQIKFLSKAMDKHEERLTEKENHSAVLNLEAKSRLRNALKSATSSAF